MYRRLVAAVAAHAPLDASAVQCPVPFLAGRWRPGTPGAAGNGS
ncbi:MAG: hypothetical protein ACLGI3_02875 [Actinomycetes bacterium]